MSVAPTELERLHAWLDGELSGADEQALLGALERDAALRAEAHALREARDILRRVAPVSAPPGFAERVIAAAEREPVSLDRWRALRRPFGVPIEGVALAAAVVLVVAVGLRGRGEDPPAIEGFPAETTAAPAPAAPARPDPDVKELPTARLEQKKEPLPGTRPSTATPMKSDPASDTKAVTPLVEKLKEGTSTAEVPKTAKTVGDGYAGQSYTITSNDPDVSSTIQSIAAKHGARAKRVTDETGQDTWFLDLDPKQLRSFVADLDKLGFVDASAGPSMQLGQTMPVAIKVVPSAAKPKAAGTSTGK